MEIGKDGVVEKEFFKRNWNWEGMLRRSFTHDDCGGGMGLTLVHVSRQFYSRLFCVPVICVCEIPFCWGDVHVVEEVVAVLVGWGDELPTAFYLGVVGGHY